MKKPIGVFDSGVGGLGILKETIELLPNEHFVYVADNKNMPFGLKTVEQINTISENIVNFLIKKHNVCMVIVACNTATVASLDYLRSHFSIPFIGTVPAVKPAGELTKKKRVAILATPLTARSAYQQGLVKKFANDIEVLNISCAGLADAVDRGELETPSTIQLLEKYLAMAQNFGADVIGLSCTQYPFLRTQAEKILGPSVTILDSNKPVAKQAKRIFDTLPHDLDENNQPSIHKIFVTKDADQFKTVAQKLIGSSIVQHVEEITLP